MRDEDGIERRLLASVSRAEGRRHLLDGSPADPATLARSRPPVAVFSPDRLALIKGPPAERRAHLDRFVAARWPSRADLRQRFGQALAQRNALVARLAAGHGAPGQLDVWDATLGRGRRRAGRRPRRGGRRAGRALRRGRGRPRAWRAGPSSSTRRARPDRRPRSAPAWPSAARPTCGSAGPPGARTSTSSRSAPAGRSLRRYGSQGQQRAALLALLFAERDVLLAARQVAPLLLLDDVMSELDPGRRERLVERLAGGGQALITAAAEDSLPAAAMASVVRMPLADQRGGSGVTRRRAPRPAATALRAALDQAAPKTPLAALQAAWAEVVGERIAAVASPVSERGGEVTVSCSDSVWAQELDLMQEQLLERLRERLGERAPQSLRFRVQDARK